MLAVPNVPLLLCIFLILIFHDDDLPDDDNDLPDSLGVVFSFIASDVCEGFDSSFISPISFPGVPGSEEDDGTAEPSG